MLLASGGLGEDPWGAWKKSGKDDWKDLSRVLRVDSRIFSATVLFNNQ